MIYLIKNAAHLLFSFAHAVITIQILYDTIL